MGPRGQIYATICTSSVVKFIHVSLVFSSNDRPSGYEKYAVEIKSSVYGIYDLQYYRITKPS